MISNILAALLTPELENAGLQVSSNYGEGTEFFFFIQPTTNNSNFL